MHSDGTGLAALVLCFAPSLQLALSRSLSKAMQTDDPDDEMEKPGYRPLETEAGVSCPLASLNPNIHSIPMLLLFPWIAKGETNRHEYSSPELRSRQTNVGPLT